MAVIQPLPGSSYIISVLGHKTKKRHKVNECSKEQRALILYEDTVMKLV